jgi:hypothetical protein
MLAYTVWAELVALAGKSEFPSLYKLDLHGIQAILLVHPADSLVQGIAGHFHPLLMPQALRALDCLKIGHRIYVKTGDHFRCYHKHKVYFTSRLANSLL